MYSNTRFGEVLKALPRSTFNRIIEEEQADKYTKGFRCWDQLVALVFNQLCGANSLRQLESGFNQQQTTHYHLGTRPLKRSTLADANRTRDSRVFERLFHAMFPMAHRQMRRQFNDLIYLLDSSPIHLVGPHLDEWTRHYRNNVSQGLKLHLILEQQTLLPRHGHLSGANSSDIDQVRGLPIETGATYVFDRGYYDFAWWREIEGQDAFFVSRLKKNAATVVIEQHEIAEDAQTTILEDAMVGFTRRHVGKHCAPHPYRGKQLRRVIVSRPDKDAPLVLVTNDTSRSAIEIADLYKMRWGIELFFKWIKQNLKIKRFLGCSENAVRSQIYVALITYLLLHVHHRGMGAEENFALYLSALKTTLFQRPQTCYQVAKRRWQERQALLELQGELAW